MSGYVKSHLFETEFDGDRVKARLKPLKYLDLLKFNSSKTDADAVRVLQEILPQYVEELTGLSDAAGSPIMIDEVCSSVYFVSLVEKLGGALVEQAQVKNPQKPAAPSAS